MPDQDISMVVLEQVNCPECKGRKKLTRYADGHAICFQKGCGYKTGVQPPREDSFTMAEIPRGLLKPDQLSWEPVRGLAEGTLRRYGSFLAGYRGTRLMVTPVYDNTGVMVAQQVRLKDGTVEVIGDHGTGRQLYGQHVYGDRYDKKVVVHSDALDAMSTGQVAHFKYYASVATHGDPKTAARDLKENYRWLDRFGEIVLFFQDTPEWQQTAQHCAALFLPGKVKIATLGEFKSANAALQAGKPGDIEAAIWAATSWRPVGIVNAADGLRELLDEGLQVPSWPYPWAMFNEKSLGMRRGEVIYHVGGTGIAKTTLMFHYAVHLIKWDGKPFLKIDRRDYPALPKGKVGWLGFEDMTRQVKMGLLSVYSGQRLHLEPVSNKEAERLYKELFGEGLLELYDPENAEYGLEAVFGYIRFMAKALDVVVLYVDPLTFLISMLPGRDRTASEEAVAARLAAEAKSLGICINIGYHLRKPDGTPFEEGGEISIPDIKGAGALVHYAHAVYGYERDQQGDRPDLLRVRAVKAIRFTGYTGVMGILQYDLRTGRYTPTDEPWPEKETGRGGVARGKASTPHEQGGGISQDY